MNVRTTRRTEIEIMRGVMRELGGGGIAFEYTIPRMGRRIDCVVIFGGALFPIEFKVGESTYPRAAIDQVVDYALYLKNFHAASHSLPIFPILICTAAPSGNNRPKMRGGLSSAMLCGSDDISQAIADAAAMAGGRRVDFRAWLSSPYKPTPTIIEAARGADQGQVRIREWYGASDEVCDQA